VLDWAHRLTLRSVEQGTVDDSPALRNLVASGLVARRDDGRYEVTPAGRVALDAGPSRWARIGWVVLTVAAVILLGDTVAGWVT
jgi:hypothetical protein